MVCGNTSEGDGTEYGVARMTRKADEPRPDKSDNHAGRSARRGIHTGRAAWAANCSQAALDWTRVRTGTAVLSGSIRPN